MQSETVQFFVRVPKKYQETFCGLMKSFDMMFSNTHCLQRLYLKGGNETFATLTM